MKKVYKIIILFIVFLISLYIFSIFFLLNFPYNLVLQYLNRKYLTNYNIISSAEKILYRFPNRLIIENLEVASNNGSSLFTVKKIENRFKIFHKMKNQSEKDIVLVAYNVSYSDSYLSAEGRDLIIRVSLKTRGPVNIPSRINGVKAIDLNGEGLVINSLRVSALELKKLELSSVDINIVSELDEFFIKEGNIRGDGIKIEMGGKLNRSSMDIGLRFRVDNRVYGKNESFQVLKNFVKDINDFSIFLRGKPTKPLISMS